MLVPGQLFARQTKILRFAGARFRFPTKTVASTAAGNNLAVISEFVFFTPAYSLSDLRFLFPAYWCNTAGGSAPETVMGNNISVYFSVKVGSGTWRLGTIGAASPAVLTDGSNNWSDSGLIPERCAPRTQITVRTICAVSDAQARPGGMRSIQTGGVVETQARRSATVGDLTPLLTNGASLSTSGGTSANVASADVDLYGPASVIGYARGRPRSVLVLGDSIDYSRNITLTLSGDSYNNQGHWACGLDAAGFGVNVAAFQGAKLQYEGATDATAGLVRRAAAYTTLPQLPFDTITSGMQHNDTSGAAYAGLKSAFDKTVTRIRSLFPGKRLVWATPLPFTTGTFGTLAGQTQNVSAVSPSTAAWQLRDYIVALAGGTLDGYLDRSTVGAKAHNGSDPEDKWYTAADTAAYTADGTHPADNGSDLLIAAVRTQALAGAI